MAAEDKIQPKKPEPNVRKKRKNYVIEDEIIKEIATKEITSQIKFEQRWSFLKAENLDKLYRQLLQDDRVDMKVLREFSKYYQTRRTVDQSMDLESVPIPKLSSGNIRLPIVMYKGRITQFNNICRRNILLVAGMIGWRSTKAENTLEKFGPLWAPPRPIDNTDTRLNKRNQYFILLG